MEPTPSLRSGYARLRRVRLIRRAVRPLDPTNKYLNHNSKLIVSASQVLAPHTQVEMLDMQQNATPSSAHRRGRTLNLVIVLLGLLVLVFTVRGFARTSFAEAATLWKGIAIALAISAYWLIFVLAMHLSSNDRKRLIRGSLMIGYLMILTIFFILSEQGNEAEAIRLYDLAFKTMVGAGLVGLGMEQLSKSNKQV